MKTFKVTLLFLFSWTLVASAQMAVVNKKGTITAIDSSKWNVSGTNIINKNSGNVGVGNPTPTYKLDVTGKLRISDSLVTNTARVVTLNSGTTNDSIVVADPITGVLKRIAPIRLNKVDSTTASNGLNLVGKDVRMGGSLTAATTVTANAANTLSIATSGSSLNITGLASGSSNDSLVVADPTTGALKRIAPIRLNKVDSTTASNGLTLTGKDIALGGSLTAATTVTANAANTLSVATSGSSLNITGLASGSTNDSLVVADPTTGALKRIAPIRLNKVDSTTASNGLNLVGKDVRMGGALTSATTVTANAANTLSIATSGSSLNITGLASGTTNDSLVVADPTTGALKRIAPIRLNKVDSTTASNGLNLVGKDVRMGGALTSATTVTANTSNTLSIATSGSSLNITGLASGSTNDSLVVADPTTGALKRIAPIRLNKVDSTTANNGLTLTGKNVALGGSLTAATTITTTATNTLSVAGLQSGDENDSLVVADPSTGELKRVEQRKKPTVIKTTTTQANSTTTAATINVLTFNTVANKNYRVRMWLVYNAAAAATGIRLGPNTFSGGNYWYQVLVPSSTTANQYFSGFNTGTMLSGTASRATTGNVAFVEMDIEATSVATVSFQFASETGGSAITIQIGSRLEYEITN